MGLSDFLGALVQSNPVTAGVAEGVMWGAEQFGEQSVQNMDRSQRGRAGGVGITATPGFQRATAIANNPANAPYRVIGERIEESGQNKIDAATGYYKAGKLVLTDPGEAWKRTRQFAQTVKDNPSILGHIVVEAAISSALDPTTYVGAGLTGGAAAMENMAARGGRRALTETVEEGATQFAAHSADELAAAGVKAGSKEAIEQAAREAAPSTAEAARVAGRQSTRSGRMLQAIDEAPVNLRETIGRDPIGRIGRKRIEFGERLMPGPQPSVPQALLKDALQANPTMPSEGAGLGFRQAKWRTLQVGRRAMLPAKLNTARQVGKVGRFLNDPQAALASPEAGDLVDRGINWVVTEHPEAVAAVGGLVAANAVLGGLGTLKALRGDRGEGAEKPTAREPFTQPHTVQSIGLTQFRLDNTRATRVSRRSRPRQLGVVTRNTMPTEVGPSDWYGPAAGWRPGRGFQSRSASPSGPLTPLEQPDGRTLGDRDLVAVGESS